MSDHGYTQEDMPFVPDKSAPPIEPNDPTIPLVEYVAEAPEEDTAETNAEPVAEPLPAETHGIPVGGMSDPDIETAKQGVLAVYPTAVFGDIIPADEAPGPILPFTV